VTEHEPWADPERQARFRALFGETGVRVPGPPPGWVAAENAARRARFRALFDTTGDQREEHDMTATAPSLYEAVGGAIGLAEICDELYRRLPADPTTKGYFDGVDLTRQSQRLAGWLSGALGGPELYQGPSLRATHAGMGVTDAAFDATAVHLVAILNERGIDSAAIDDIGAALTALRPEIVTA